jgi:hypothetical protein
MALVDMGLDASPSRERLGRVVELLRGVEDAAAVRRPPARRKVARPVAIRPMRMAWAAEPDEPVA